ncbi:actin-domain-containing protein [Syncephalastrum racemosum]|uniref:Actin-domain-containing protein n=1 Tax=Syncephalastrum racemosum TaxID=13706 RepID=A0A1X2HJ09_SYNRA|nr:actin-domain-containing protein [Syncephalastrum racemosum]
MTTTPSSSTALPHSSAHSPPLSSTAASASASASSAAARLSYLSSAYGGLSSFTSGANTMPSSTTSSIARRASIYSTEDRVVLDVGSCYIKVGFSSECRPRHILSLRDALSSAGLQESSEFYDLDWMRSGRDMASAEAVLANMMRAIFFGYLLTDPKQRTVIVCESPMVPLRLKEMLARILFEHLQIPALCFAPSSLLALLTTGKTTGLVIDCGHLETTVLPIYCGRPLPMMVHATPLAGRAIAQRLRTLLLEHGRLIDTQSYQTREIPAHRSIPPELLTTAIVEDIQTRCIFVSPTSLTSHDEDMYRESSAAHDLFYRLDTGSLWIPGWVRERAADILFTGDKEEEVQSITECILDCVAKTPTDLRRPLIGSLLIIGGTAMIAGLRMRLQQELAAALQQPKYQQQLVGSPAFLTEDQNDAGHVFSPNCRAWVGGSLAGSLKLIKVSIQREQFDGQVPDWSRPEFMQQLDEKKQDEAAV